MNLRAVPADGEFIQVPMPPIVRVSNIFMDLGGKVSKFLHRNN